MKLTFLINREYIILNKEYSVRLILVMNLCCFFAFLGLFIDLSYYVYIKQRNSTRFSMVIMDTLLIIFNLLNYIVFFTQFWKSRLNKIFKDKYKSSVNIDENTGLIADNQQIINYILGDPILE